MISWQHGRRAEDTIRAALPELITRDVAREARYVLQLQIDDEIGVCSCPGAHALVAPLPPSRWAVVTGCDRRLARLRLRSAGLPVPDVLVTSDEVTEGKPNPSGYRAAATALGFPPRECVVVEDSAAGVMAAQNAGEKVIAVCNTHLGARLVRADLLVPDLLRLRAAHEPNMSLPIQLRAAV